jgi:hypothetical protein
MDKKMFSKNKILNRLFYMVACGVLVSFMGCQSSDIKSDLSLDEVITRWHKTTDPNGILKKCNGYIIQQEATVKDENKDDVKIVTVIYYKSPSTFKTVQFKNGKIFRKLYVVGKKAYAFSPKLQKLKELKGRSLNLVRIYTAVGDPKVDIRDLFKNVTLSLVQENEMENSRTAKYYYKLVCDTGIPDVPGYTIYIDRDTFLTYKMETVKMTARGNYKYISFIKKYGVLDSGVRYALETENISGNIKTIFYVTNYEINPMFRKDEFKLPEPWFDKQ